MIDLNLKASSETNMADALLAAGFIKNPESGALHHHTAALKLLPEGLITRATGEVRVVDGIEMEVREAVPGYHANVRTTDAAMAAALAPVTVVVETPQYVWA